MSGSPGTPTPRIDVLVCAKDALLIKKVHLEASKPVSAYDFILGSRLTAGEQLI